MLVCWAVPVLFWFTILRARRATVLTLCSLPVWPVSPASCSSAPPGNWKCPWDRGLRVGKRANPPQAQGKVRMLALRGNIFHIKARWSLSKIPKRIWYGWQNGWQIFLSKVCALLCWWIMMVRETIVNILYAFPLRSKQISAFRSVRGDFVAFDFAYALLTWQTAFVIEYFCRSQREAGGHFAGCF